MTKNQNLRRDRNVSKKELLATAAGIIYGLITAYLWHSGFKREGLILTAIGIGALITIFVKSPREEKLNLSRAISEYDKSIIGRAGKLVAIRLLLLIIGVLARQILMK